MTNSSGTKKDCSIADITELLEKPECMIAIVSRKADIKGKHKLYKFIKLLERLRIELSAYKSAYKKRGEGGKKAEDIKKVLSDVVLAYLILETKERDAFGPINKIGETKDLVRISFEKFVISVKKAVVENDTKALEEADRLLEALLKASKLVALSLRR